MDPEKKSLNFIFPTKYVIPKSLKFSHWPSKVSGLPSFLAKQPIATVGFTFLILPRATQNGSGAKMS